MATLAVIVPVRMYAMLSFNLFMENGYIDRHHKVRKDGHCYTTKWNGGDKVNHIFLEVRHSPLPPEHEKNIKMYLIIN